MISEVDAGPDLVAKGLTCKRGNARLFKDLHMTLHARQLLWLRGANGCGKTSFLRLAAGLVQPHAGDILWRGQPVCGNADFKSQLVYIGHTPGLQADLTAREALHFLAKLHGSDPTQDQLTQAMKRMDVHHRQDHAVRVLSQGQKKRVALARLALETGPGVWVLDEPLDALDGPGIDAVHALIAENIARGGRILLSSHIPLQWNRVEIRELDLERTSSR